MHKPKNAKRQESAILGRFFDFIKIKEKSIEQKYKSFMILTVKWRTENFCNLNQCKVSSDWYMYSIGGS